MPDLAAAASGMPASSWQLLEAAAASRMAYGLEDGLTSIEQRLIDQAPPLTIVSGHYGVGKTNLSLNLVDRWLYLTEHDIELTLIDLDVVNPYFRSSDSQAWLTERHVPLIGPAMSQSTLDTPSLAPGIDTAIRLASPAKPVLIDAGGDPDGARALARFADLIKPIRYQLVYVANYNRPEVATATDALAVLQAIEHQSGLKATAIIANSHLKELSSVAQIIKTIPELEELARLTGLPVAAVSAPADLAAGLARQLAGAGLGQEGQNQLLQGLRDKAWARALPVLPVQALVKAPWE